MATNIPDGYQSAADYVRERFGLTLSPEDLADLEAELQALHGARDVVWYSGDRMIMPHGTSPSSQQGAGDEPAPPASEEHP